MGIHLSQRIQRVNASATMQIAARTIELQAQGYDIISFGVGEPDFDTPDIVKNAAKKALDDNQTHYTLTRGIKPLRQAISDNMKSVFNINYSAEEIIVTNGAKHALFNIMMVLVDSGDEVIVPLPCWPSYPELVNLTGGKIVNIKTNLQDDFKITPQQLRDAITPRTKIFMFCNPNNPTGTTYSQKEMKELANVLEGTGIYVISDEIYGRLIYEGYDYGSFGQFKSQLEDKIIVLQGASKAYAMTGWRLGFAAGPREIIQACDLLQSHSTSNVSSISQHAAICAFSDGEGAMQKMRASFDERRQYLISFVKDLPGFYFAKPTGAFYIFPNIKSSYGVAANGDIISNANDLALYLLKDGQVAVVPGNGFGAEDHIRMSYTVSLDRLKAGLERMKKSLNTIKKVSK